jgi:hypothetical protein
MIFDSTDRYSEHFGYLLILHIIYIAHAEDFSAFRRKLQYGMLYLAM